MKRIGYRFKDIGLLQLALTHRSVSKHRNNERLEFLGDAQLGLVIARRLFDSFPEASEGQLTRMRASLVCGRTLAEVAREMNLGDYLNLGPGELKSGGWRRDSILADAVEAIIGAIVEDTGEAASQRVLLGWFEQRLTTVSPKLATKDGKTQLQEWLQARQQPLPDYVLEGVTGQPPQQVFRVSLHLEQHDAPFIGEGSSRRRAEQVAAANTLQWLEKQS